MTIENKLRELAEKAHVGGAEKWVPYTPLVARDGDAFVRYEDGTVVARIPERLTLGGTFVHNRLAIYIAALDPSTVKRLLDVVEAARTLADGLSDAGRDFYAPQLAALARLDEGEQP